MQARGNTTARTLDRLIGIPLLSAAGLFTRRRGIPDAVVNVAVISLGCIGDTLLLDGPLRDLLAVRPGCRVTLFTNNGNLATGRLLDTVREVIALPLANPLKAFRLLRQESFDVCIDAGQWARVSALYALAARSRHRIGFATPGHHRHYAFDTVVDHLDSRHELDNFRALFAPLGINGDRVPTVTPQKGIELPKQPFAVFHMLPSGRKAHFKEWPEANWKALAEHCAGRGITVLLSGSPADAPRVEALAQSVGSPDVRSLAGRTGLAELAALLRHARFVVSVNTGIMHLAAAVGAPLVSLNGPTSIMRWGAVTAPGKGIALAADLPCAPCLHLGFEYGCSESVCMRSITVEQVIEAAENLLQPAP